jgi:hypothetical protein
MAELNSVEKQFVSLSISCNYLCGCYFSMSAFVWVIEALSYSLSGRNFHLQRSMRAQNPVQAGVLLSIVNGQTHNI